MYNGFRIEVENITRLTDEQLRELYKELAVLAVSTNELFINPVQVTGRRLVAYYLYDIHAQETVKHLSRYLRRIGMERAITVTLRPARW